MVVTMIIWDISRQHQLHRPISVTSWAVGMAILSYSKSYQVTLLTQSIYKLACLANISLLSLGRMQFLCYYAVHNGIMVVVSLSVCGWWIMRESVKMQRSLFRPVGKKDGAWLDLAEFEFAWWYINSNPSSTGPSSLDKRLLLLGKKLVLFHLKWPRDFSGHHTSSTPHHHDTK